jgi:hypothetical protein
LFNHCTFSEICRTFCAHSLSFCWIHREINSNWKDMSINTSTQLREMQGNDSQDMLVLSSTVASRYDNCCTCGSTSTRNYGYPPLVICLFNICEPVIYKMREPRRPTTLCVCTACSSASVA